MDQKVTVKNVYEYFGYRMISGNDESLNREITVADVNRPGLELVGYFTHSDQRRVVIMGDKEISYIDANPDQDFEEVFDKLTNSITPMILISHDHECPAKLLEIAKEKEFPIFTSFASSTSLAVELVSYLEEQLASSYSVHAELMNIYGVGTLIQGDSGVGKSEIALELLKRGHILVADDRVDLARIHNRIQGQCPELLRNMLEIRGIGIISAVDMFGITSTMPKSNIDLVINLVEWEDKGELVRVGNEENEFEDFFGVSIKKITLPVRKGRSMAAIIESAVMNHILLKRGINSPEEFSNRVSEYLEKENEKK